MKKKLFISFTLFTNLIFSQIKEQELQEIEVREQLLIAKPKIGFILKREEILSRQAEDLGDLMRNIPGISLKNYGGLGGLKTISARGINGTHSGIIIDGFLVQNSQTAQVDLSTVQIENLKEIHFTFQNTQENLDVVSSYFNANNLKLITYENQFSKDTFQLRSNFKIGSFGQFDSYLGAKWNRKNFYVSYFGKYRRADGDFPFKVENYSQNYELTRINNDLKELYSGLNFGFYRSEKSQLKIQFLTNFSDKGLPGAVILYNATSNQRLKNQNSTFNSDYTFSTKKTSGRAYLSARYDELIYIDSGYLNKQGFLKSEYYTSSISIGTIFRKNFSNGLKSTMGIEENYFLLHNSTNFGEGVQRFHSKYILDFNKSHHNKWNYSFSFGVQHIFNQQINDSISNERFSINPAISICALTPIYFLGELKFTLRRTMRMPSFNEMYYNQIGNALLEPEIANQFNLGTFYSFNIKNNIVKITIDGYANLVENKIVAVPTKNLFIWSIQNIGVARVLGYDFQISHERNFNKKYYFQTSINYTFQNISDISDKNSATYSHQLAYLPKHIINGNFSFQYKNSGLNINAYYNSLRYALNENIKTNAVAQFYIFDFTCFYQQKLNSSNLRYSFSIKNCLNQSYAYIRNYQMPGRNYLFSISYLFN